MIDHTTCCRWSPSLRGADGGPYSDFIDGLGPGQLVGRQVLGASSLGDIQLSMCQQKGYLEVEVIRARGLQVSAILLFETNTIALLAATINYSIFLQLFLSSSDPVRRYYQHRT